MGTIGKELDIVKRNYQAYLSRRDSHHKYIAKAKRNENFYWGDGGQWRKEDRKKLESAKRFVSEHNKIQKVVDTAVGQQLQNRVDMAFKPRNLGDDEAVAEVLTKVIGQICDDINYTYNESQVYEDGRIEQRGFMEFRVEFDDNMKGEIVMEVLDPRDCIPDPNGHTYKPDKWKDFIKLRWMSIDEIEEEYGKAKADKVRGRSGENDGEEDINTRNAFGDDRGDLDWTQDDFTDDGGVRMHLVIDRQLVKMDIAEVAYYPDSGDEHLAANMSPEARAKHAANGALFTKKAKKRIRWTVTCGDVLLHDDWSPYRSKTIIPYFPRFRRGRTQGDVDNLISPQETYNKLISQYVSVVNSTANSGWIFWEGSLVDMGKHDLAEHGASTGLVIEVKEDKKQPEKIQPNQIPQGLDRMIERCDAEIESISGVDKAQRGLDGKERSGVALDRLMYAGGAQRAKSNDNLALTRHMAALKLLELVQDFYTERRVIMITERDNLQQKRYVPVTINDVTPEGRIINDLTIGEYDVVVTEMPNVATFMDSQFNQAKEMRQDMGIRIPDARIIEMSSLTKKHEIIKEMAGETTPPPPDPKIEAEAELARARARLVAAQEEKVKAEAVSTRVETQYSAIQTAGVIASVPDTAGLGDDLLGSAGYVDANPAPIMPQYNGGEIDTAGEMDLPANTNPTTPVPVPLPPDPTTGVRRGIETQMIEEEPWQRLTQ